LAVHLFIDRKDAGSRLAKKLEKYKDRDDVIVLALPRGGVPVGIVVAQSLKAHFDIFIVRKLGVPGQKELAMGSIAMGDIQVENEDIIREAGISRKTIDMVAGREREELIRMEKLYRGDRPWPEIKGRIVILVDDGLATGASMQAAIQSVRRMHPGRIVAAVPIGDPDVCRDLENEADEVVCVETPRHLDAISSWYKNFRQVSDKDVRSMLEMAER